MRRTRPRNIIDRSDIMPVNPVSEIVSDNSIGGSIALQSQIIQEALESAMTEAESLDAALIDTMNAMNSMRRKALARAEAMRNALGNVLEEYTA